MAGEEGLAIVIEAEAVRQDRRDVEAPGSQQVEVDLHRVLAGALEVLLAEGVRTDQRDLLEVERRPLEAPRDFDAGDDDRTPGSNDADPGLDGLGQPHGVVDHVDAAIEHREPEPGCE